MALPASQINRVWLDRAHGESANMLVSAQRHEPSNWRTAWRSDPFSHVEESGCQACKRHVPPMA